MAIIFDPKAVLKKIAPESKIKRLINGRMSLKRTALNFVDRAADTDVGVLNKKAVAEVAKKTVASYKERIAKAVADADFDKAAGQELKSLIFNDPKQLIQRIQNEVIFQVHEKIKDQYGGEKARWLPSDAEEPRPEHQLNYGKTYIIGEGINGVEPGDEFGCRCGIEIITNDTQLDLS